MQWMASHWSQNAEYISGMFLSVACNEPSEVKEMSWEVETNHQKVLNNGALETSDGWKTVSCSAKKRQDDSHENSE